MRGQLTKKNISPVLGFESSCMPMPSGTTGSSGHFVSYSIVAEYGPAVFPLSSLKLTRMVFVPLTVFVRGQLFVAEYPPHVSVSNTPSSEICIWRGLSSVALSLSAMVELFVLRSKGGHPSFATMPYCSGQLASGASAIGSFVSRIKFAESPKPT